MGNPNSSRKKPFSINVLWTKAGSNSTLMVRPEKSTIELTADLRNINVKMKPMPINAPSTFELGDTITLWCKLFHKQRYGHKVDLR